MSQTNVVSGFAKLTQLFLFILFVYALHQGWRKIISRQTLLKHAEISQGTLIYPFLAKPTGRFPVFIMWKFILTVTMWKHAISHSSEMKVPYHRL
jgi:hypothetical protein